LEEKEAAAMKVLKVGLLATIFLAAFSGVGCAQGTMPHHICLSDTELDQVLVPVSLHKLGAMLGTCMRKYPNLEREGSKNNSEFYSKYSADIKKSASSATQVFSSHGIAAIDVKQLLQKAYNVAIKTADAYDEKQCRNVVSFMELLVVSDGFDQVKAMAHADFQSARASIPVCTRKPPEEPSASLDEKIVVHNAKVLEETKKRCLLPKFSRLSGLDPLDAVIFDQKCRSIGIEPE
jgi:hypothetical protein